MLFFLTGDIQIGKTRWLQGVIDELTCRGVDAFGVIAPGRWVKTPDGFQKLGIDNVMLPQGERVNFADPAERGWCFHDDAIERVNRHFAELVAMGGRFAERDRPVGNVQGGCPDGDVEPACPIDDAEPGRPLGDAEGGRSVGDAQGECFIADADSSRAKVSDDASGEAATADMHRGFLVIDELGWMELERGGGLTNAVELLDAGAAPLWPHALVIVRETLLPLAQVRFSQTDWGGVSVLRPNEESRAVLVSLITK